MRRVAVVVLVALVAAPFVVSSSRPAGAGATTDLYVVHGLNLDHQASQIDRGTPMTVCSDAASLIADFQFGDVVGPVPVPSGQDLPVQVYGGANVDCEATLDAPLIDQIITPDGAAFSVVATSPFGDQLNPELLSHEIDTSKFSRCVLCGSFCVDSGTSGAAIVHAANEPELAIFSLDLGFSYTPSGPNAGELWYGEAVEYVLDPGIYVDTADGSVDGILIIPLPLTGEGPIIESDLPVTAETLTLAYVVGHQPSDRGDWTPAAVITQEIPVEACEQPVPPATPPAATPTAAKPTFTG